MTPTAEAVDYVTAWATEHAVPLTTEFEKARKKDVKRAAKITDNYPEDFPGTPTRTLRWKEVLYSATALPHWKGWPIVPP